MLNWGKCIERSLAKKLYRASRLSATKNSDYLNAHADESREFAKDGKSASAQKRIITAMESHLKKVTAPAWSPDKKRFNK